MFLQFSCCCSFISPFQSPIQDDTKGEDFKTVEVTLIFGHHLRQGTSSKVRYTVYKKGFP